MVTFYVMWIANQACFHHLIAASGYPQLRPYMRIYVCVYVICYMYDVGIRSCRGNLGPLRYTRWRHLHTRTEISPLRSVLN